MSRWLPVLALLAAAGIGIATAALGDRRAQRAGPTVMSAVPRGNALWGTFAHIGPDDAPVVVRVFGDLECGACALFEEQAGRGLRELAKQGRIRFEFYHAPLRAHRRAPRGALAHYCAALAGAGWSMWRILDARRAEWAQGLPSGPRFERYAAELDLPAEPFRACLDDDRAHEVALRGSGVAEALGVAALPTIRVDDRWVRPRGSFREVLDYVGERLSTMGVPPPASPAPGSPAPRHFDATARTRGAR